MEKLSLFVQRKTMIIKKFYDILESISRRFLMKKLCILILTILLLTGCSSKKEANTLMVTRDNVLYALYNDCLLYTSLVIVI